MCTAFSISKSKRNLYNFKNVIPGPGMYRTDSFLKISQKKNENLLQANSIENSEKICKNQNNAPNIQKRNNAPGPGAYNVNTSDFEKNISKKFNSTFSKAGMNKKEEK